VPVAGPCDVLEASQVKLPPELFNGPEEQHAAVDPVLAVLKHVVGVEHHPAVADVSDLEPFPEVSGGGVALGVSGLASPPLP